MIYRRPCITLILCLLLVASVRSANAEKGMEQHRGEIVKEELRRAA